MYNGKRSIQIQNKTLTFFKEKKNECNGVETVKRREDE